MKKKPKLPETLAFRMTAEDKAALMSRAEKQGIRVGVLVRQILESELYKDGGLNE